MKIKILAWILYKIVWLLRLTYRFKFVNPQALVNAKKATANGSYIFACLHEYSFSGILTQKGIPHQTLISKSKDGELMNYTCTKLGYLGVRGSSSKGGKEAREELKENIIISKIPAAITVDGPRGPRRIVKPGIIDLARVTQVPIVTITAIAKWSWCFSKSWDQFKLPKPFTKIYVKYSEPLFIPSTISETEFDEYREKLKNLLIEEERSVLNTYL